MSAPRYAALMAEARAEFAADFRALGARVERRTRFRAGAHYRRVLDYDPWCRVCGRATTAKGLCITCYSRERRRAHDPRYARRYTRSNTTCGHLDRKHHAKGRCNACYLSARQGGLKNKGQASTSVLCVTHPCPARAPLTTERP